MPEPEDGTEPADLITNVITNTPKGQRVLFTCLITKIELLKMIKYNEISPYTGNVDAITKEYEAVMQIFEARHSVSQVIGNEKEIEKVIEERKKRKEIKIQTKIVAQEAMYG
jgi:hypothetical protein